MRDQQISSLSGSGDVALGSNTLIVGNSDNLSRDIFSGTIVGSSGSLVKTGAGTLVLAGSDSYGGTTVDAGTLVITSAFALPDGTSLTVGAGGTFIFDPSQVAAPVVGSAAVAAVPEPGTLALLLVGLVAGFGVWLGKKY